MPSNKETIIAKISKPERAFRAQDDEESSDQQGTGQPRREGCREPAHRAALHRASERKRTPSRGDEDPDDWRSRLSRHGARRLQQRGITMPELAMVMAYGTAQRVQGATRFVLSRRDRQLLAGEPVELAAHLLQRDILVVASDDDRVITVAHRTGRIPRQLQPRWRRRTH